jgi:hypothetical protein
LNHKFRENVLQLGDLNIICQRREKFAGKNPVTNSTGPFWTNLCQPDERSILHLQIEVNAFYPALFVFISKPAGSHRTTLSSMPDQKIHSVILNDRQPVQLPSLFKFVSHED